MPAQHVDTPVNARTLSRLRWRCRRGMLENDLYIERFFQRHEACLTMRQAEGLEALMALSDNDLLNLLMRRREPRGDDEQRAEVVEVLALMRAPAAVTGFGDPGAP